MAIAALPKIDGGLRFQVTRIGDRLSHIQLERYHIAVLHRVFLSFHPIEAFLTGGSHGAGGGDGHGDHGVGGAVFRT